MEPVHIGSTSSNYDAGINAQNEQKWQIFMADDTNIYLIASNYITRQYTGTKNNVGFDYDTTNQTPATATKMWFTSILGQYNANSTITDIPTILSKIDKQNIYHKWMNTEANQTRNYNNEKAVASMLGVDVWSGYKNTTYAKYAIGGPTIEMFFESYNKTHGGFDLINVYYQGGYKVRKEGTEIITDDAMSVNGLLDASQMELSPDINNMYFKNYTFWIASPLYGGGEVFRVRRGIVDSGSLGNNSICFRPLVCLKSNVHLVLNEDKETYSLELD